MTEVREQLQIEKVKVSLKSTLLDYGMTYKAQFKQRWDNVSGDLVDRAIVELESEQFLVVQPGKQGGIMLWRRDLASAFARFQRKG